MKTYQFNQHTYYEIPKGNGYYYISPISLEILSLMRPNAPRILKPTINGNGYYMVGFFTKPNRINVNLHRALMETFVPNPQNFPHINHIDGNKLNNTLSNLEWCSSQHNTQHAHDLGLATTQHCERSVHQYDLNGNYKASFPSLHEAARQLFVTASAICNAIQGKYATAGNSLWSYTLTDKIPSYTGVLRIDYYLVNGVRIKLLKDLCLHIGLTRASIQRRFKKFGNMFTEGNFTIVRIPCI